MENQGIVNKIMGFVFFVLLVVLVGELFYIFYSSKNPPVQSQKVENTVTTTTTGNKTEPTPLPDPNKASWDNWQTKYKYLSYSEMVTKGEFVDFETVKVGQQEQVKIHLKNGDDVFYIFYFKDDTSQVSYVDSKEQPIKEADIKPGDMLELREVFDRDAKNGDDYTLVVKKTS